jgi:hypothetical protein
MAEVKAYAKPPPAVETVMEAVMVLRKQEPTWTEAKKQLGDPNFLMQLVQCDPALEPSPPPSPSPNQPLPRNLTVTLTLTLAQPALPRTLTLTEPSPLTPHPGQVRQGAADRLRTE